jgi:lipopolysaccharide export system protein LptC
MHRPSFERFYPLIALTLLAAGTIWLERATRQGEEKATTPLRHDPDLTIQAFTLHRYDLKGAQQYQLSGARAVHFPDDDTSLITRPQLVFSGEGRPFTVVSEQATVFQQGERVFLEGDVRAERAGDGQHAPMSFRSATLTVWPGEERGESRTPLVLTQGETVIHAQAMDAQNLIGELQLGGGVTARLQRNKGAAPPPPDPKP